MNALLSTPLTRLWKLLFIPISFLFVGASNDLVTFTIHNDSDYDIHYLYLSNADDDMWGEDHLGSEILNTGESFSLLVYPSVYDIKLVDEDEDECIKKGINIRQDLNWRITTADLIDCIFSDNSSSGSTVAFTIRNNSQWDIHYIYLSANHSQEWGSDHLGSTILNTGESFTINVRPGTYDLKMIDEDGDECIQMDFNINNALSWSFGDSEWLDCIGSSSSSSSSTNDVTFVNTSLWDIYNMYISPSSSSDWGSDRLGSNILNSGETYSVSLPSGTYDIKLVDEDGDECIRNSVSISSDRRIEIDTDSWLECIN